MFERRRTRRSNKIVRISMLFVLTGLVIMVLVVYKFYGRIFEANVSLDAGQEIFYIPSGADFEFVIDRLEAEGIIDNKKTFRWVSLKKRYDKHVKPGRYRIRNGSSNNELVNMLRSGNQDPVMVVFNNVRTLDQLAGKVSQYLEGDSAGVCKPTFQILPSSRNMALERRLLPPCSFPIPMSSSGLASPEQFTDRMKKEYEDFWQGERDRKAERLEMTRAEVVTLASIVDEETMYDDENERVAGVYINRLEEGDSPPGRSRP